MSAHSNFIGSSWFLLTMLGVGESSFLQVIKVILPTLECFTFNVVEMGVSTVRIICEM